MKSIIYCFFVLIGLAVGVIGTFLVNVYQYNARTPPDSRDGIGLMGLPIFCLLFGAPIGAAMGGLTAWWLVSYLEQRKRNEWQRIRDKHTVQAHGAEADESVWPPAPKL